MVQIDLNVVTPQPPGCINDVLDADRSSLQPRMPAQGIDPKQYSGRRHHLDPERLRGRDSNPDYLIQSQASYH